jgi:molybdopterin synthase sulfur carrier subunit
MAVTVLIPTPLRKFTGDRESVTAEPGTIGSVLQDLDTQFGGLAARVQDENGNLRKFVNIYVNEEDIRFLQGKETPVNDGDTVSIVPAIAGG